MFNPLTPQYNFLTILTWIAAITGYLYFLTHTFISIRKLFFKKRIFLICPVRNIAEKEKADIAAYVEKLEKSGRKVHWPLRDTDQEDSIGLRICTDNCNALTEANEIHIWYNKDSMGSLFDFGCAFSLKKEIIIVNPEAIEPTPHKSFGNVLLEIHKKNLAK